MFEYVFQFNSCSTNVSTCQNGNKCLFCKEKKKKKSKDIVHGILSFLRTSFVNGIAISDLACLICPTSVVSNVHTLLLKKYDYPGLLHNWDSTTSHKIAC